MAVDFSKGKIWKNIIHQTVPLLCAQLVQLLYNVVDRMYIGHLPEIGKMALTGVGLAFPITTLIAAFTNLYATGGNPLFSMARGSKEEERATEIINHVFVMLCATSVFLMAVCLAFRRPILFAFGASEESYVYANEYLQIYLLGTVFSMLTTGLNGFINSQGYPKIGMGTIIIGAVMNLILDPIMIFGLSMGVRGAALATIISQFVSMCWVFCFLKSEKNGYQIKLKEFRMNWKLLGEIVSLGLAGFIVQATNCLVQIVCNKTLRIYGGDLYVGIMTVLNSVREIMSLPGSTLGGGAQPVISYNYGAKEYSRVKQAIRFTASIGVSFLAFAWLIVYLFSKQIFGFFTSDAEMVLLGAPALKLYFFGFFFMAFQFAGQSTFTALGCSKRAIFFSIFRKVIIVVPLSLLLPKMGFGVTGVFLAEPISNAVGGLASFLTMYFTLYRKLPTNNQK